MDSTYDVVSLSWKSFVFATGVATVTSAVSFFFVEARFWAYAFVLVPIVCLAATTALGVMIDRRLPIQSEVLLSRRHASAIPYVPLVGFVVFVAAAVITEKLDRWLPGAMVVVSISMGSNLARILALTKATRR